MKLVITLYSLHHIGYMKLGHTKEYFHHIMLVIAFSFVHLCVGASNLKGVEGFPHIQVW